MFKKTIISLALLFPLNAIAGDSAIFHKTGEVKQVVSCVAVSEGKSNACIDKVQVNGGELIVAEVDAFAQAGDEVYLQCWAIKENQYCETSWVMSLSPEYLASEELP